MTRCRDCGRPGMDPCLRYGKGMPEVTHEVGSPYFGVVMDGHRYTGCLGHFGRDMWLIVSGPVGSKRPSLRTYSFGHERWLGGPLNNTRFWAAADKLLEEARTRRSEIAS